MPYIFCYNNKKDIWAVRCMSTLRVKVCWARRFAPCDLQVKALSAKIGVTLPVLRLYSPLRLVSRCEDKHVLWLMSRSSGQESGWGHRLRHSGKNWKRMSWYLRPSATQIIPAMEEASFQKDNVWYNLRCKGEKLKTSCKITNSKALPYYNHG